MADPNEGVKTIRRYYLLKAFAEQDRGAEFDLFSTWWAKQAAVPGTPLSVAFPSYTKLTAARYTTIEDLTGASVGELERRADLTRQQADAVIAALG